MSRTLAPWRRTVGASLRHMVDLVLPPSCPVTDAPVDAPGHLAASAWRALTFITAPLCERCGLPFSYDPGSGTECAACAARPPAYDRARSAFVYDDASRKLVIGLKHAGRMDGLATFASWMASAGGELWRSADWIVPIPLHRARLRHRGYNQAALLARAVSALVDVPFNPDILLRRRRTPTQDGKSARERNRNVAGAFRVPDNVRPLLSDAHILLVDDVHTTGATLNACAHALRQAGAVQVDAVTLARVVRPRDVLI